MKDREETSTLYRLIARMKAADAGIQALCFLAMAGMYLYNDGIEGILFLAGAQCFSTLFWLFVLRKDISRVRGGMAIRIIFLFLMCCAGLGYWLGGLLIWGVVYVLFIAGPFSCIAYFIITLAEVSFYRKMVRESAAKAR